MKKPIVGTSSTNAHGLSQRSRGVTLSETLVVVAVVMILLGLILPLLSATRRRAYVVDDMSRLRQLGQAAAMYHERHNRWPRGVPDVVSDGLAPSELASSGLDRTFNGIGNAVVKRWPSIIGGDILPEMPYRLSYVGQRELQVGPANVERWIVGGEAGGWLLDVTLSAVPNMPDFADAKGNYRRLTYDGAVVVRTFADMECSMNGKSAPCRMPMTYFVDPGKEMKQWIKSIK